MHKVWDIVIKLILIPIYVGIFLCRCWWSISRCRWVISWGDGVLDRIFCWVGHGCWLILCDCCWDHRPNQNKHTIIQMLVRSGMGLTSWWRSWRILVKLVGYVLRFWWSGARFLAWWVWNFWGILLFSLISIYCFCLFRDIGLVYRFSWIRLFRVDRFEINKLSRICH